MTAFISAWDSTKITMVFVGVWLVKEFDAVGPPDEIEGSLSELRECFGSELIAEAQQRMKLLHCSEAEIENLRHFRLLDDSDTPVLEIVAHKLEMHHASSSTI